MSNSLKQASQEFELARRKQAAKKPGDLDRFKHVPYLGVEEVLRGDPKGGYSIDLGTVPDTLWTDNLQDVVSYFNEVIKRARKSLALIKKF